MLTETATKATDRLLDNGVLGVVCVLLILLLIVAGLVIRKLYSDVRACDERAVKGQERFIQAMEAGRDAAERSQEALKSLRETLDTRGNAVGELSHQVEIVATKVQHGFGNLSQALESFVRLIDLERGRRERP